jgi:hypothetical protein
MFTIGTKNEHSWIKRRFLKIGSTSILFQKCWAFLKREDYPERSVAARQSSFSSKTLSSNHDLMIVKFFPSNFTTVMQIMD